MTITHRLAALAVGATLALAVTAGCATPHTTDGYISEMRAEMDDYESRNMADAQIVTMGQTMCSYPDMLEPAFYQNDYTSPAQQESSTTTAAITKRYCDVLPPMVNPVTETDAGMPLEGDPGTPAGDYAAPPPPPAPVTVGSTQTVNYGGQDVATWTVDKIDRCGPYLRMTITMTTSDLFAPGGTDGIMHRTQWTDTQGVTHDGGPIMAFDCGDELVSSYSAQPGKTYKGVVTFDIPEGQLAALDMIGSDDRVNTYTPERTEER